MSTSSGKLIVKKGVGLGRPPQKYVTKKQMYKAIHRNIENKVIWERLNIGWSSIGNIWSERTLVPSQGTGISNRVGNEYRIKSIEINGVIAEGSSEVVTDDPWNVMRIVIGLWDGDNAAPLSGLNMNDVIRKTISPQGLMKKYYDKYIPLQVVSTEKGEGDGYVPTLRKFKYFKLFKKPIVIKFGGSTATTANKQLVVSMISDSLAISHPGFVAGYWAISYEDA